MDFGSAVHKGFEAYFRGKSYSECLEAIRAYCRASEALQEGDQEQVDLYAEISEKAPLVFERALTELPGKAWRPIAVEQTFSAQLTPDISINGTPDLIAEHIPTGKVYLLDWKTRGTFQELDSERFNLQFVVYQWLLAQNGIGVVGSMIYEIISEVPKAPKINKDGSVSKAKVRTTWPIFKAAIDEVGGIPEEYSEMKKYLENLEWERTTPAYRSEEFVDTIIQEVVIPTAVEMASNPIPLRVLNRFSCTGCNYAPLCIGELEGNDLAFIRSQQYTDREGKPIPLVTIQ